jgi:hypothetical protein
LLLYYFTSELFGLQAIRDRRIKLARIHELNDPFEFLGFELRSNVDRSVMTDWKSRMNERYGLMCMSRGWQQPLLWGHYADKHKGICLGFEVPENDKFAKIEYVKGRLQWPTESGRRVRLTQDHMRRIIFSKFEDWRYEQEWRAVARLEDADSSGLYFSDFGVEMNLKRVVVGERCRLTRSQLQKALGKMTAGVELIKARSAFKTFAVVRNKAGLS